MESPSRNRGKDGNKQENLASNQETLLSKRYRRNIVHEKTLILSIRRSRASPTCRELFPHSIHGSRNSIPKPIITFDEKYVIRCLELIRSFAVRAAAWNFTSKVDILPDHTTNLAFIENSSSSNMAIESEVVAGDWTIGTLSGSQTMINILKSPLLQNFGSLDQNPNFIKTNLLEPYYSPTLEKEVKVVDHRRDVSMSSTSSSFSDQSSSSGYSASFQGMLQCTWKDGRPHHVFTVDDKREVYIADLSEPCDDRGVDYFYTFHRRNGKRDSGIHDLEMQSIAKMRVYTSIKFEPDNSEIRETHFVLSINTMADMQTLNHAQRKNKNLTKKMVDVFRPSHSYKKRSSSKFGGSTTIAEEDTPSEDVRDTSLEFEYAPNNEMAAVVVKEIYHQPKEVEFGGWGLKFLKKSGNTASPDAKISSKISRDRGECSTSMDILIPAGLHGGPRTRIGGPSSLIERWLSGGQCDCGGWDIGCPLTTLNTSSGNTAYSLETDNFGECKSIDLFMQGSKQNGPMMKMVNIHKGLYYIHFQSSLSSLQAFAVAAAMIHSRVPILRSEVYRT